MVSTHRITTEIRESAGIELRCTEISDVSSFRFKRASFNRRIRLLPCPSCAGPVMPAAEGGACRCAFCSADFDLPPRPAPNPGIAQARPLPENKRLAYLRAQEAGWRPHATQGLDFSVGARRISAAQLSRQIEQWLNCRVQTEADSSDAALDALLQSSFALARHFRATGDELRSRAFLEGALEACVNSPWRRQAIVSALARAACCAGDLTSAQTWLDCADPRAEDLIADSSYRLASAQLETLRGDYAAVIQVLGDEPGLIPLDAAFSVEANILRANAVEQHFSPDLACHQLRALSESSALGASTAFAVPCGELSLTLCPQSHQKLLLQKRLRRISTMLITLAAAGGALAFVLV